MDISGHLRPARLRWYLLAMLVAACASIWTLAYGSGAQKQLTLALLDIGQGDSIYIESPAGVQVLIDGGPDGSVLRQLGELMPPLDRSLDAVIETHPDADHIGGLVDVLNRYEVDAFITPGIPDDTQTSKALSRMVADKNIPVYIARRGMTLDLGDGAYLHILFPDHDVSGLPKSKTNDGSVVARLVYGDASALLTGDAPANIETHLVELDGAALKTDLLKIAHHGSKYSSTAAFLAAAAPAVAVISVGANNRYGHPAPEVLERLAQLGIPYARTDEQGTIVFRSGGTAFERQP